MNYRMIARILGMVLLILAALLVLPLIAGLCYGENVLNFAVTIAAAAALGGIFMLFKPKNRDIYAREGFTAVGLSWILMSLIGALPLSSAAISRAMWTRCLRPSPASRPPALRCSRTSRR